MYDPTIAPERVTVFGTSNAIMTQGWLRLSTDAARAQGLEYDNRSIGGSSSLLGAAMIALSEPDRHVVCDFLLNDQMLIDMNALTPEQAIGQHICIAQGLIRRGMADRAVVLLLPLQRTLTNALHGDLFTWVIDVLTRAGIRYLDLRALIPQWAAARGEDIASAYADDRHLSPDYQRLLGEAVVTALRSQSSEGHDRAAFLDLPDPGFAWLTIAAAPPAPPPSVKRVGTSLLSLDTLEIPDGAALTVAGARWLVGGLFWSDDESGALIVRGETGPTRLLLRRGLKSLFLFDSYSPGIALGSQTQIEARNDRLVPAQKGLGVNSSIYGTTGAVSRLAWLIGCDVQPVEYAGLLPAKRD